MLLFTSPLDLIVYAIKLIADSRLTSYLGNRKIKIPTRNLHIRGGARFSRHVCLVDSVSRFHIVLMAHHIQTLSTTGQAACRP